MRSWFLATILIVSLTACRNAGDGRQLNDSGQHARGFKIEKAGNFTTVTVFNPWSHAENISLEYVLIKKGEPVHDSLSRKRIIRTPVERVICLSTTHIGFLDVLDATGELAGISGARYISSEKVRKRMEKGEVPDIGFGQNINYELILSQNPELVIVYGIDSEVTSQVRKLEELGIPVVLAAEFLEETPLGKAEWVKFFGVFFEKEEEAREYFEMVEKEYLELKLLATDVTEKPKVIVGSPYKDSWWIPGGNSYLANLIADAGGDYLGKNNPSNESYVISFEQAFAMANEADVWINMSNLASKKEILSTDERFKNFTVFNNGKIFNNIKRMSNHGGNDFWESGPANPHRVLSDLIAIFHSEIVGHDMVYYQEIK